MANDHPYAERYGAHKPITALYRPAKQAWLARNPWR